MHVASLSALASEVIVPIPGSEPFSEIAGFLTTFWFSYLRGGAATGGCLSITPLGQRAGSIEAAQHDLACSPRAGWIIRSTVSVVRSANDFVLFGPTLRGTEALVT